MGLEAAGPGAENGSLESGTDWMDSVTDWLLGPGIDWLLGPGIESLLGPGLSSFLGSGTDSLLGPEAKIVAAE